MGCGRGASWGGLTLLDIARPAMIITIGTNRFWLKKGMARPKNPATITARKMRKPRVTSKAPGFAFLLSSVMTQFKHIMLW
jgi:hypothetical protein